MNHLNVMRSFRHTVSICLLSVAFCSLASAQDGVGQQPQKDAPPSAPSLTPSDDLGSAMESFAIDLQMFFQMNNRPDYTVTYGIGTMTTTDPNSSNFITSLQLAYKEAMLDAYVKLATVLSPDGMQISTEDSVTYRQDDGDSVKDALIEDCKKQAAPLYARYVAKLEREKKERMEARESMSQQVIDLFKSDERAAEERLARQQEEQAEPPPPDFVHECEGPGDVYVQTSSEVQSIADTLTGGRIWTSMMHNGEIAVVLLRSGDTAEVAAVLKDQLFPAKPLSSAFAEVRTRIVQEVADQPGLPMGIVGTRMMRLSNGEWALYAFGAAQLNEGAATTMDRRRNKFSANRASGASLSELSRFSGLMINFEQDNLQTAATKETFKVVLNMTQGTEKFKTNNEETIGNLLEVAYNATSDLNLRGSMPVFNEVFETNGSKYRLTAQAWSPSIMASNSQARSSQDAQAENATQSGKYVVPGQQGGQGGQGESKPTTLNTDW